MTTNENFKKIEEKFNFLEKHFINDIKIIIDEWGFFKENIQYSIWLSNEDFISIYIENKKIELIFDKKNSLVALEFLDIIKTVNIYDEKEIRIYDIEINIEKKIEYKSDDCLKSIGNILNYIENKKDKIKIEVKCNKEENNYIIWIESKNYENLYLKWKSY